MAQGLINNGVSVTKNFTDNELELLSDIEITSATTQVDFTGLNIQEDEEIVLKLNIFTSTTNEWIRLRINGNTTSTNYYMQYISVFNTTINGVRENNIEVSFGRQNLHSFSDVYIKLTNNGYVITQSNSTDSLGGSGVGIFDIYGTSTFQVPSITKLTFIADQTSGIGIGSRFQLYKVKGQVQQTWATS